MYNRYIPQPDGSYRRSRIQDPPPQQHIIPPQPSPPCSPLLQEEPCPAACPHKQPQKPLPCTRSNRRPQRPVTPAPRPEPQKSGSIGSFLKHLLPGDFDTGDLLIVLLLLLMAGDCQEDQNSALLTLVLYLFL